MSSKFLKCVLVIAVSGAVAVAALYGLGLGNACPIKQIDITSDIKRYGQTKDPELCAQINDEISQFDNLCKGNTETLDCG